MAPVVCSLEYLPKKPLGAHLTHIFRLAFLSPGEFPFTSAVPGPNINNVTSTGPRHFAPILTGDFSDAPPAVIPSHPDSFFILTKKRHYGLSLRHFVNGDEGHQDYKAPEVRRPRI
jgi:hypothetical protein